MSNVLVVRRAGFAESERKLAASACGFFPQQTLRHPTEGPWGMSQIRPGKCRGLQRGRQIARVSFQITLLGWRLAWPLELATDQPRAVVDDRSIVTVLYIPYRTRNWSKLVTTAPSTPEKAYRTQRASRSPRSVLERFDSASFADTEEDGLSTPTPQATRRDLARRIAIIDTVLDLRNYEQHLLMEYFSSLLCTTPTEEHEERDDKIVRVDLTARTGYAPYNETDAVDEEVAVTASSRAPPLAGPHYTHANPGARPLIRRPHLDGEQTYDDPESAALIARARALLPPPEDEGPEDPNDAILRKARRMCGKPEEEGAPAPEAAVEKFDPFLARAKALSLHASRVAAELESQIAAIGKSAPVEAPAPAIVISKEEQDLVARARALIADTEPAPPPMAPSSGAVPAAPSSGDPEELMARIARLAQAEVEPPMTFEPLNTNVEARVEAPPVDDDLIRRARALRGASKVARTTSK